MQDCGFSPVCIFICLMLLVIVMQGISDVGRAPCPSPPPGTLSEVDKDIARQSKHNSRCSNTGSLGEFIPEEDTTNQYV